MSVNAALLEFESRPARECRCRAEREADCICADELRERQLERERIADEFREKA